MGSAANGSAGPCLLRGPRTAKQSSSSKQELLCSDNGRACYCKWDSWAAPKAATFSSQFHAAHLRLPITECNPLKLQTSHHIT